MDFLGAVYHHNSQIKSAMATRDQSRLDVKSKQSIYDGTLTIGLGKNSRDLALDFPIPGGYHVQASVGLSSTTTTWQAAWTLPIPQSTVSPQDYALDRARLISQKTAFTTITAIDGLLISAATDYMNWALAIATVAEKKRAWESAKFQTQLAITRYKLQTVSDYDRVSAELAEQVAYTEVLSAQAAEVVAGRSVARWISGTMKSVPSPPIHDIQTMVTGDLPADTTQLRMVNPKLKADAVAIEIAKLDARYASDSHQNQWHLDTELMGTQGRNSPETDIRLGTTIQLGTHSSDGGIGTARISLTLAERAITDDETALNDQITALDAQWTITQSRIQHSEAAVRLALRHLELANKQFQLGIIPLKDIIDANHTVQTLQIDLDSAIRDSVLIDLNWRSIHGMLATHFNQGEPF